MGYRARVVKAGSVDERTDGEYFNRRTYEIRVLFQNHHVKIDHDSFKYKEMWTIKETELNALIALLEESPDEVDECFFEDMDLALTNQKLANCFKDWVKEADKETGLIRILWS